MIVPTKTDLFTVRWRTIALLQKRKIARIQSEKKSSVQTSVSEGLPLNHARKIS